MPGLRAPTDYTEEPPRAIQCGTTTISSDFVLCYSCGFVLQTKPWTNSHSRQLAEFPSAVWGGAKLADVHELFGIPKLSSNTPAGGTHVEFVSIDKCKEEKGGPYKASIPLSQASNPEADVLLTYEKNGEPLNSDHGYPLRVVVPSVTGARSVKWLDSINIIAEPQLGQYRLVYKEASNGFSCSDDVSGGGRGIERVDISVNGGKTWVEASRYQKAGVPYIADDDNHCEKWAWVFFEADVEVPQNAEIVVKAVDVAANVQPENVEDIWNLRGVLNTSWHRVKVHVGRSSMGKSSRTMQLYLL
ncbi:Sulfite oxidase-like protein [Drosera capensis]